MSVIKQYEEACEAVRIEFIEKYHLYDEDELTVDDIESFWIGDEIGGVCFVDDMYMNINHMVDALKYKPTKEQFNEWYWNIYADPDAEINYNLKSYLQLKIPTTT